MNNHCRKVTVALIAWVALFGNAVSAQVSDTCNLSDPVFSDTCKELYDPKSSAGDSNGAVLSDETVVTVELGEGKDKASIQFVKPWLGHKLAITISAPVDKNTDTAEFLDVTGINSAASLKLEYNYINWPEFGGYERYKDAVKGTFPGFKKLNNDTLRGAALCAASLRRFKTLRAEAQAGGQWSQKLEDLYSKAKKLDLPTPEELVESFDRNARYPVPEPTPEQEQIDAKVAPIEAAYDDKDEGLCHVVAEHLDKLSPAEFYVAGLASRFELTGQSRVPFFGVNGTVGQKEFKFLDRILLEADGTLDETSNRELPWSLGLRGGWIFLSKDHQRHGERSLAFSLNTERSYKAATAVDLCNPVEGFENVDNIESCKKIPLGAPNAIDALRFLVEYRALVGKRMGVAVRGFYLESDDQPDDYGFEVPFFFVPNKDGNFQGGVTMGWSDQADDIKIAVFVGRKFNIF